MLKVCLSVCPSQSETSFFILRLFELLMTLYCRLSMVENPNPLTIFTSVVVNSTTSKNY